MNSLRHILKNKAYTGVYEYSDIMIEDGMPRLVSDELFEEVQKSFERNKHKAKTPTIEEDAPRYWLTGKLYCGKCGATMHGMSGTSKTGKIHYYYACKNHRKHKCSLRNIPQLQLKAHVMWVFDRLVITWYYMNDESTIDLDTLTEITDTKNTSNDKDVRSSTLKQSAPFRGLVQEWWRAERMSSKR